MKKKFEPYAEAFPFDERVRRGKWGVRRRWSKTGKFHEDRNYGMGYEREDAERQAVQFMRKSGRKIAF